MIRNHLWEHLIEKYFQFGRRTVGITTYAATHHQRAMESLTDSSLKLFISAFSLTKNEQHT